MSFRPLRWLPLAVLVGGGWLGYRAFQRAQPSPPEKVGFQAAAEPLRSDPKTNFDPRLMEISAWVREQIPYVNELTEKSISESAIWGVIASRKLGDPSPFARADGLVIALRHDHVGAPGQVTLAHRLPTGQLRFSYHSPLTNLRITRLQLVGQGAQLGEPPDPALGRTVPPKSALEIMRPEHSQPTEVKILELEPTD